MQIALPETSAPQRFSASTVGLSGKEKFDFWHDVVCRNVVDLDCQSARGVPFEASIDGVRLGDLNLWRIDSSAHSVTRNPSSIARASSESVVLNFVVEGRLEVEQDGGAVSLDAGDGALCDGDRPYTLQLKDNVQIACAKLPRSMLSPRSTGLRRATAVSFAKRSSLCPMVFGYLVNLTRCGYQLSACGSDKVARNFTELLGAMLDEVASTSQLPLSDYRSAALVRVKDFVQRHASDHSLDCAAVANALKLSPRYINRLMEAEGTSLARYIWRLRLERAARDLRDPALMTRSVSVIAMSHGFNDLSHFSKAFRGSFGRSPREFRLDLQ